MKISLLFSILLLFACSTKNTLAAISVLNFNTPAGTTGVGTTGPSGGAPTGNIVSSSVAVNGGPIDPGQNWTLTAAYATDSNIGTTNETVRVSQVSGVNHGFRLENTSPYINSDVVGATFSFAQATPISISAGLNLFGQSSFNSNMSMSDRLTLTGNTGVTWSISDTALLNVISNVGNVIIIEGTGIDAGPFAVFDIRSSTNLTSFTVEQRTVNIPTSVNNINSSQMMIAIVPEPSHSLLIMLSGLLALLRRKRNVA